MATRILLAEDHALIRQGIGNLLRAEPDFEVVGEADSGPTAVTQTIQARPDVVLMDVGLPGMNGIDATREIKKVDPDVLVLALSVHSDRRFVDSMLDAGASGYMLKDGPFPQLLEAIRTIRHGDVFLSPQVEGKLSRSAIEGVAARLSMRERQVLTGLAEGSSNQQIADRLGLSRKTVETHRAKIIRKTGIRSIAGMTKFAIRIGLTSLND
ncbi:MAG TPA: response regulator transcription factor [bacterium]|nr:response regulator transcription factor [bacterium]